MMMLQNRVSLKSQAIPVCIGRNLVYRLHN
jgi:hypothetical protein